MLTASVGVIESTLDDFSPRCADVSAGETLEKLALTVVRASAVLGGRCTTFKLCVTSASSATTNRFLTDAILSSDKLRRTSADLNCFLTMRTLEAGVVERVKRLDGGWLMIAGHISSRQSSHSASVSARSERQMQQMYFGLRRIIFALCCLLIDACVCLCVCVAMTQRRN